eukprot:scaffold3424_cov256-Pinguiococcus_pyrenoidosus.AAC.9
MLLVWVLRHPEIAQISSEEPVRPSQSLRETPRTQSRTKLATKSLSMLLRERHKPEGVHFADVIENHKKSSNTNDEFAEYVYYNWASVNQPFPLLLCSSFSLFSVTKCGAFCRFSKVRLTPMAPVRQTETLPFRAKAPWGATGLHHALVRTKSWTSWVVQCADDAEVLAGGQRWRKTRRPVMSRGMPKKY